MDKYQIMKEIEKLNGAELESFHDLFQEFYMRKLHKNFDDSINRLRRLH
jgi:hypothetical protein